MARDISILRQWSRLVVARYSVLDRRELKQFEVSFFATRQVRHSRDFPSENERGKIQMPMAIFPYSSELGPKSQDGNEFNEAAKALQVCEAPQKTIKDLESEYEKKFVTDGPVPFLIRKNGSAQHNEQSLFTFELAH